MVLERADLSRRDLRAVVAALATISDASEEEFSPDDTLLELALDAGKPSALRAMALQSVNIGHKQLTVDVLASLARTKDIAIQREAIRSLSLHSDTTRASVLGELAADNSLDANLRADAIAGMAALASGQSGLLEKLTSDSNNTVSAEAFRSLVSAGIAMRKLKEKPPTDDIKAWQTLIDEATGKADTAIGRRLFFHPRLGGCYKCHSMNGRGHHAQRSSGRNECKRNSRPDRLPARGKRIGTPGAEDGRLS